MSLARRARKSGPRHAAAGTSGSGGGPKGRDGPSPELDKAVRVGEKRTPAAEVFEQGKGLLGLPRYLPRALGKARTGGRGLGGGFGGQFFWGKGLPSETAYLRS